MILQWLQHSHISPIYINVFFHDNLIMSITEVDIYTDNSIYVMYLFLHASESWVKCLFWLLIIF